MRLDYTTGIFTSRKNIEEIIFISVQSSIQTKFHRVIFNLERITLCGTLVPGTEVHVERTPR